MAKKKAQKATKTRLTVADKFYIINNPDKLTHLELAKAVGCSEVTVDRTLAASGKTKKRVEKVEKIVETNVPQTNTGPTGPISTMPTFDSTISKVSRKGQSVGIVLTSAAAEIADATRSSNKRVLSESMKNAIHKPKG